MEKTLRISLPEIPAAAKKIAKNLKGGEIFALVGALGSGKTTFVKALGRELKVKSVIASPTFILMQVFPARLKSKKNIYFCHLDLYRAKNFTEVKALGLPQIWGKKDTVTLIEWADKIKKYLPKKSRVIKFV